MEYEVWEKTVPPVIRADSLWHVKAYRLAMFLADLGWSDTTKLMSDRRTIGLADQVYRSLSSIGADIAEGYSRGTGKDRARFYEYALGQHGKAGTGITRAAISWVKLSSSIAWASSPRLFVYC